MLYYPLQLCPVHFYLIPMSIMIHVNLKILPNIQLIRFHTICKSAQIHMLV